MPTPLPPDYFYVFVWFCFERSTTPPPVPPWPSFLIFQEQRALWECTLKNAESAAKHDGRRQGSRYHPVVIRLALELSSSASAQTYDEVAEMFFLPTTRYLQKYKNFAAGDGEGPMLSVISNMKIKAASRSFDADSWDMCGVLSFDAMTVAQKIAYNPRTGSIVGLPWERDEASIGIVMAEYKRAARRASGARPEESEAGGGQLELAQHYNVYYFNSLGRPDFAFPVARYCMGSITSASLLHQYNKVTLELALRGFHVAVSVCDGAGENRAFNRISAEVPASTFFSTTEAASWAAKGINLDFKVAKDSLLTPGDMYTFHLSDFPHALKKIVNAMEMSSRSSSGRDLKMPSGLIDDGKPFYYQINLGMLREVWQSYNKSAFSSSLQRERKLTDGHFTKNAFTRMRVYLAMQVVSTSMVRIIDAEAHKMQPAFGALAPGQIYEGVRTLCVKLDRLVDILNSTTEKDGIEFVNGPNHAHLDELMETLAWFADWKARLAESDLPKKEKKASFLPDECWADLQSLVLGFVCACKFYLAKYGKDGAIMIARRCSQDIVEHHFAHVRASRKSGPAIDSVGALKATGTAAARRGNRSSRKTKRDRGSHAHAPLQEGDELWTTK